jgi:hypothetical protein
MCDLRPRGKAAVEERDVAQIFYPLITALALLAAVVNFALAVSRRQYLLVVLVRTVAGLTSLALAGVIVLGKALDLHIFQALNLVDLQWSTVFIAAGVFVFIVLWFPSYVERASKVPASPSIQERAARPAKATVRLQRSGPDEWVN